MDLENWTEYQLELFTLVILGGYHGSNYLILNYSEDVVVQETETIKNRLELIIRLIDIEKKISAISNRSCSYNDISCSIFEGLDFINDYSKFVSKEISIIF